jgi:amino acid transporter
VTISFPPITASKSQPGGVAAACLLLATFCGVIVFLPPEGRISAPLHDAVDVLLGRASFMLPLALGFVGVMLIVRRLRPMARLPRRRLIGVALVAVGVLASEHLLAKDREGTGLIGRWLTSWLVDLLGQPLTVVALVALLTLGTLLAFNVRLPRAARSPRATS